MIGRRGRGLIKDRAGSLAAMTALLMPVLIGAAGLASDTVQWTLVRRALQRQADSAALAGAYALSQNRSVTDTVTADLDKNNNFTLSAAPIIENAPTVGPYVGDSKVVRVRLTSTSRLPFTGLFMGSNLDISVEASAGLVADGEFCILALDNTASLGITNSGNTTIDARCGMHSNSSGEPAINGQGSAVITATPVSAVGNVDNRSNVFTNGTTFQPYTVSQPDPFAGLPVPNIASSANNGDVKSNQSRDLSPGTYRGMDIQGTAKLTPGVYYIDGRAPGNNQNKNLGFNVGSQGTVSCPTCTNGAGVTIVLTMSNPPVSGESNLVAGMKINAGATIDLPAPSTGDFKGVLFYQDRRATTMGEEININGNSGARLQGAIYTPKNQMRFNGTTGFNINCLQMVAHRFVFTGNSSITNVCPANSGSGTFKGTQVRLMG
jgi:Flp pilus assembly protein TadG